MGHPRWGLTWWGLTWWVLWVALAVTATRPGCAAAEAAKVESFPLVAPGITFCNFVSTQTRSLYTLIPTGIAAGDVDGDGLCDLYFCSSDGTNVVYRNLGNWQPVPLDALTVSLHRKAFPIRRADFRSRPLRFPNRVASKILQ
ncbi:MAG: hypothetical protein JWR69_299 [Pedosphaera sp.]|nr:hypothetical protein [Pedosphaera sp.]